MAGETMGADDNTVGAWDTWKPFGHVSKTTLARMTKEERKGFIMKKSYSAGVTMGLLSTAAFLWVKRENNAKHFSDDGIEFGSIGQFIDYEEETGARISGVEKEDFLSVAKDHKLETAGIFAATTGAVGWMVHNGLTNK